MPCGGCGQPLPARAGPGRPARYHNAACRQRAHRVQRGLRTTQPDNAALLAAADRTEQTVRALRAAVITGHDLPAAITIVLAAAARLVELCHARPTTPPAPLPRAIGPDRNGHDLRLLTPADPIDPSTVRLERNPDRATGGWRVLTKQPDGPAVAGLLTRALTGTAWQARTPQRILVPGGPWRTRRDALTHLLRAYPGNHQR
jgi:hypothetical protein